MLLCHQCLRPAFQTYEKVRSEGSSSSAGWVNVIGVVFGKTEDAYQDLCLTESLITKEHIR